MKPEQIYCHIDHTLLRPTCTWNEIQKLCEEAIQYQTASVCIPPSYVKRAAEEYGGRLTICTVIGFPLGYHTTEVKACETKAALRDGADEIDMVINLTDVKNGEFDKITNEIRVLKECVRDKVLKLSLIHISYSMSNSSVRNTAAIFSVRMKFGWLPDVPRMKSGWALSHPSIGIRQAAHGSRCLPISRAAIMMR